MGGAVGGNGALGSDLVWFVEEDQTVKYSQFSLHMHM